jgi:hypothetical protein
LLEMPPFLSPFLLFSGLCRVTIMDNMPNTSNFAYTKSISLWCSRQSYISLPEQLISILQCCKKRHLVDFNRRKNTFVVTFTIPLRWCDRYYGGRDAEINMERICRLMYRMRNGENFLDINYWLTYKGHFGNKSANSDTDVKLPSGMSIFDKYMYLTRNVQALLYYMAK